MATFKWCVARKRVMSIRFLVLLLLVLSISHRGRAETYVPTERIQRIEQSFERIQKDSEFQKRLSGGMLSGGGVFGVTIAMGLSYLKLADEGAASQMVSGAGIAMLAGAWILGGASKSESDSLNFEDEREYSLEGIDRTVQWSESAFAESASRAKFERIVDGSVLLLAGGYNLSLTSQIEQEGIRSQLDQSGMALVSLGSLWAMRERRLVGSGLIVAAGFGNLFSNVWKRGPPTPQFLQYTGAIWMASGVWLFLVPRSEETEHQEYSKWKSAFVPIPGGAGFLLSRAF